MPAKPNSRNWNDVQTAIATVSIVTTLGMWNLFATPAKTKVVQASEPINPPAEPSAEAASMPTAMPQVKIMFTPGATQTIQSFTTVQQAQTTKKKKNKNNGGGTVTQTKTS